MREKDSIIIALPWRNTFSANSKNERYLQWCHYGGYLCSVLQQVPLHWLLHWDVKVCWLRDFAAGKFVYHAFFIRDDCTYLDLYHCTLCICFSNALAGRKNTLTYKIWLVSSINGLCLWHSSWKTQHHQDWWSTFLDEDFVMNIIYYLAQELPFAYHLEYIFDMKENTTIDGKTKVQSANLIQF